MHLEGYGTLFSGIEKLVAGLYMTMLPEAGGEFAVLHAHDTGHGINLGSPPPALVLQVCQVQRSGRVDSEKRAPYPSL